MSTYTPQIQEWTQPLRSMTGIGASIASLVLAMSQTVQDHAKVVTTIPDGNIDLNTLQYRTSQGLITTDASSTSLEQDEEQVERNNSQKISLDTSGLFGETLAELIGASHNAYWHSNRGIEPEHVAQLTKWFDTFQELLNFHIPESCSMTDIGTSIASLVLVPDAVPVAPVIMTQTVQDRVKAVTTIPDGSIDLSMLQYRTSQGLITTDVSSTSLEQDEEQVERNNIPKILLETSGLSVETLAELIGVSHYTYNKWLSSGDVELKYVAQLTKWFDTFQELLNLSIPDLRGFLENVGPYGKPLDLLAAGDIHAVIGLASRSVSQYKVSSIRSVEAHQTSRSHGWLRPVKKLKWEIPRLEGDEREDAHDRLSPGPVPGEVILSKEDDE